MQELAGNLSKSKNVELQVYFKRIFSNISYKLCIHFHYTPDFEMT